jgi:hypothetical protein
MSEDLRVLIDQAIKELTVDGYELLDYHIAPSQRTVAISLQAIDGQLGPKGGTMLFAIGTSIIRAVMLLEAAQARLAERGA